MLCLVFNHFCIGRFVFNFVLFIFVSSKYLFVLIFVSLNFHSCLNVIFLFICLHVLFYLYFIVFIILFLFLFIFLYYLLFYFIIDGLKVHVGPLLLGPFAGPTQA